MILCLAEYINQLQIIFGILGGNYELIEYQLAAAVTRLAIKDVGDIKFTAHKTDVTSGKLKEGDFVHYPASLYGEWVTYLQDGFQSPDVLKEKRKGERNAKVSPGAEPTATSTVAQNDRVRGFGEADEEPPKSLFDARDPTDGDGDSDRKCGTIPITLMCMGMLLRGVRHKRGYLDVIWYAGFCGALLVVIQPFIISYYDVYSDSSDLSEETRERYQDPYNQMLNVIFYVCATILNLVFMNVILTFLSSVVLWVDLKRYNAMTLNRMLNPYPGERASKYLFMNVERVEESMKGNNHIVGDADTNTMEECRFMPVSKKKGALLDLSQIDIPVIAFDNAGNVFAFLYARLIMETYGKRFNFRFDVYVAVLMQGMGALMVFTALMLFFSSSPSSVAELVLFRQAMISVVVFTLYFIAMVVIGGEVNLTYTEHRKSFMRHITNTQNGLSVISSRLRALKEAHGVNPNARRKRRKITGDYAKPDTENAKPVFFHSTTLTEDEATAQMEDLLAQEDRLQDVLEALLVAMDAIDQSTELLPVTFLELESTYGLAYTIFTTVLSFFAFIAAMITGDEVDV